ncbi:MAG: [LysW]-aminoadipate/[LysW]-glutamate kinase [Candidatus Korarchaeum sp.]
MPLLIVKLGGRTLRNLSEIVRDLANYEFLVVHGGGDEVSEVSRRMGIEPKFVTSPSGVRSRYTDEEELKVYVMVMSLINRRIVNELLNLGLSALGISGVDGPTLIAERKERIVVEERGKRFAMPGGYTGRISEVRVELIRYLMDAGYRLVLSPIARGTKGEMLNVDADQAAVRLADALLPEALVILTDVDGVIVNDEVRRRIHPSELSSILNEVGAGMNRKLLLIKEIADRVRVIVANGLRDEPVTRALNGEGTSITIY